MQGVVKSATDDASLVLASDVYGNEPLRQVSFLEAICKRPGNYTFQSTFIEVIAFLEGFYMGIERRVKVDEPGEWSAFRGWAREKSNDSTGGGWVERIRSECATEQAALERLIEWFREFKSQAATGKNSDRDSA